jgi:hypothetical protein
MCELIGGATYKELAARSLKVTLELSKLHDGRSRERRTVAVGQLAQVTVGLRSGWSEAERMRATQPRSTSSTR